MNEIAFLALYFSVYLWGPFVGAIIHSAGWMDLAPRDAYDIFDWVLLTLFWPVFLGAALIGVLGLFLIHSVVGVGNAIGKALRRDQG